MKLATQTLVVLFQIYFVLGAPPSSLQENRYTIVGGENVTITDYPYQVQVLINNEHSCGGSILNNKYILSAAHCFELYNASKVTVKVGSSYRTSGGEIFQVVNITSHPNFHPQKSLESDVAILELATNLTYGPGVAPTVVPSNATDFVDGDSAVATGWGFLVDEGEYADQLQAVTLPLITTETCQQSVYSTAVTQKMFCAGEGGKDTCTGDDGGPLVLNGVQVGISSWGGICGLAKNPGVYVKLSKFLPFINKYI